MHIIYTIKSAFHALVSNKARSALTILGIVIGIASIMVIMSMGTGAQDLIVGQLQGLGADTIVIRPGREPTGPTDIAGTLFADSLKVRDIDALKIPANVPNLAEIAPALFVTGPVSYRGDTYSRATTFGWSAKFMGQIVNVYPARGVFFDDNDIRSRATVAVIGAKVASELYPNEDALGKMIKIKNKDFRIVGILPPKGQTAFFNVDDVVVVPYTTAQSYLLGVDFYNEVMVKVKNPALVDQSVLDIERTLRQAHHITDPSKDDFFVVTQKAAVEQISTILNILTIFLSVVVAISLVVGGIGVMNIMLVSVTERTREIGLRKALGATERNILTQFLIESIFLTGAGGVIGVALGTAFSFLVSVILTKGFDLSWTFVFPFSAALLGIGMSVVVGMAFGIYPARKAARKNPIEALGYE